MSCFSTNPHLGLWEEFEEDGPEVAGGLVHNYIYVRVQRKECLNTTILKKYQERKLSQLVATSGPVLPWVKSR